MRVLNSRTRTVNDDLVETIHAGLGYRIITRGGTEICNDSDETYARVAKLALTTPLAGKTVAWIGGGFCVGPRLFAPLGCIQTVYELEPALAEFCPSGITFFPGDYHATLTGTFDVIVFDLAAEVPRAFLAPFLKRNGVIIP